MPVYVVVQTTVEHARAWWASPEYTPAKTLHSASTHMLLIAGSAG